MAMDGHSQSRGEIKIVTVVLCAAFNGTCHSIFFNTAIDDNAASGTIPGEVPVSDVDSIFHFRRCYVGAEKSKQTIIHNMLTEKVLPFL